MRRITQLTRAISLTLLACGVGLMGLPAPARAELGSAPSLAIAELKITSSNGQFVTLYNATDSPLDMAKYQLEYFNSYDLSKATSNRLLTLSGMVPPHGYYMINDSELQLCYQLVIDSVSLGFSSTAGYIELLSLNQAGAGSAIAPSIVDHVAWSKTAVNGVQTLPASTNAFLMRQPLDAASNPAISADGAGTWLPIQPDPSRTCGFITYTTSTPPAVVNTGLSQLLPSTEPPLSEDSGADASSAPAPAFGPWLPANDIGLMSPRITELLPNPTGSGNDASNEFVELYNPNDSDFDLSGFSLQTGITTHHTYTFLSGTVLPAGSFMAFYSATTHLSLSNTKGKAALLDPTGNVLSTTEVYSIAADGQAWAYANGRWQWTTLPTPGAPNQIDAPVPKVVARKSTATTSTKAAKKTVTKKAKAAKTASKKVKKPKKAKTKQLTTADYRQTTSATPIHLWVLALAAGLAILYGAYEYRTDLANRIHQLRGYLGTRSKGG